MASSTIQSAGGNAANPPATTSTSNATPADALDLYAVVFLGAPTDTTKLPEYHQIPISDPYTSQTAILNLYNQMISSGLALTSIEIGVDPANNNGYFSGVFTPNILEVDQNGVPSHNYVFGVNEETFMQMFDAQPWKGMRLLDFAVSPDANGNILWSGSWGGKLANQMLIFGKNIIDFMAQLNALQGMRLSKVQTWSTSGTGGNLWVGLLEGFVDGNARVPGLSISTTFANFQAAYGLELTFPSYLIDYRVFDDWTGTRYWIGTFENDPQGSSQLKDFRYDLSYSDLQSTIDAIQSPPMVNGNQPSGICLKRVTRYYNQIELPNPNFDAAFPKALGTKCMGYEYCVFQNGVQIASGFDGKAQSGAGQPVPWHKETRMNIASLSKSVTGVAMMKALGVASNRAVLDQDFFPMVKRALPGITRHDPETFYKGITVRNLLTMDVSGSSSCFQHVPFPSYRQWFSTLLIGISSAVRSQY